jgi:MerR family transcriptional regulator, thiopeptide resistance regulator
MTDAPSASELLTAGELARLAGITVRTLHHYDEIELLRPSGRGAGGRRLYGAADAARLARILAYRALEFPLDVIASLLDGAADEAAQLREQLALLTARIAELERIRDHVLIGLEAHEMNIDLTPAERLEVFGDDPAQHEAEARKRWGNTDAWRESSARGKGRTKEDWARVKTEQDAGIAAFAAAMRTGEAADGPAAMDLAEAARCFICEHFYDLSPAMHRRLAELYTGDPRFAATYDRHEPGLARYVHDAIHANADRAG